MDELLGRWLWFMWLGWMCSVVFLKWWLWLGLRLMICLLWMVERMCVCCNGLFVIL